MVEEKIKMFMKQLEEEMISRENMCSAMGDKTYDDGILKGLEIACEIGRKIIFNRQRITEELTKLVQIEYDRYKEKVISNEEDDYCDEMALMYNFRKYLQHISYEEKDYSTEVLQDMLNYGEKLMETFMDIYWNCNLGNSYEDIKKVLDDTLDELEEEKE